MIRFFFKKGWLFMLAAACALLLTHDGIRHTAASFFLSIQKPFSYTGMTIKNSFSSINAYVQSKKTLEEENRAMRSELQRIKNQEFLFSALEKNYTLLLETLDTAPQGAIPAQVLTTPRSHSFDSIILNKGAQDGVTIHMKAVLDAVVLVGFVEEVFEHASRIRMLSSFNNETQLILEHTNAPIRVQGNGGGSFIVALPRNFPIEIGDRLFLNDARPLLAAFIESIDESESETIREAKAIIPFNPQELSFLILLP